MIRCTNIANTEYTGMYLKGGHFYEDCGCKESAPADRFVPCDIQNKKGDTGDIIVFFKRIDGKTAGSCDTVQPSAVFCGSGRCIFSRRTSYGETGSEITYWEEHNDDAGI